jgi:VanZ family protein
MVAALLPDGAMRGAWVRFWYSCGLLVVKGYHAAEFALLFLLLRAALARVRPGWATPVALAVSIGFAASDEWHQTFVPGRGGTWEDVAIDSGGVVLAAMLARRRNTG